MLKISLSLCKTKYKYIILLQFDNRPGLSQRDVIHEAIQVANIADLYFKSSLKTRLSIVYLETWQLEDMAPGIKQQNDINRVSLVSFLKTLVFFVAKLKIIFPVGF
jgi:hypothetical protein